MKFSFIELVHPSLATANAMNATPLLQVQAQAQAQAQVTAVALQQNAAAANFGKVFTAYPPLHSFRLVKTANKQFYL